MLATVINKNNDRVTRTSVLQEHVLAAFGNSMRADIEENPGWGVPNYI